MDLFDAVKSGDVAKVKEALSGSGVDPNVLGPDNVTPLMVAAEKGFDAIVEALLYAGAEPSLRDRIGETALMKAAANAHREVFRRLEPLGTIDEAEEARALMAAFGMTHAPEKEIEERFAKLKSGAARAGARAASFVGHDNPQNRVDRIDRADKNKK